MKNVIWLILLSSLLLVASENFKKVKVYPSGKQEYKTLAEVGIDHYWKDKDGGIVVYVSEKEFSGFEEKGLKTEILVDDWIRHYRESQAKISKAELKEQLANTSLQYGVNGFDFGSMGGFYTLDEVYEKLDEMYSEYPNLITRKESIGISYESRDIYFVKISDNPTMNESEPEVMYTALHHSREPQSMMQMIYFMFYLLENYGTNAEVTYLVDNREMYFIPVVNPDGYEENRRINSNGGGMHRKNMRVNTNGTIGVDLNRNYGPMDYWDSPNGGSSLDPQSNTYRGTEPFSEPETAAIREFLITHEIRACLNYHSFGNLLIYPYGALGKETPDSIIFREFGADMTQFNNYVYGTDDQTVGYTTRGNSDDFFYDGEVELKGKIFAMTPEVGSGSDGFWPTQNRIIPLAEENVFPNLYYAWVVGGFVAPTKITVNEEYLIPGETTTLNIGLKNKGLEDFDGVTVQLSANNNYVEFLQNNILVDNLLSWESISLNEIIELRILDSAAIGQSIEIYVTTYKDEIAMFTLSQKFRIGQPASVFSSNPENFEDEWLLKSNNSRKWSLTNKEFFSDSTSITDSPDGNYLPDSKLSFELVEPITLGDSAKSFLVFETRFEIENGWDYGQVLISSNSGNTWLPVGGELSVNGSGQFQPTGKPVYSGRVIEWTTEEIDLTNFLGKEILIKFELNSDVAVEMDGWYIDDIEILTYGYGVTSIANSNVTPAVFTLENNYPNPFNPSTTIRYSIPVEDAKFASSTNVELLIYDILGREVVTLVDKKQKPGSYKVEWDASNFTSGVYFYTLRAGDYTASKKMLILK